MYFRILKLCIIIHHLCIIPNATCGHFTPYRVLRTPRVATSASFPRRGQTFQPPSRIFITVIKTEEKNLTHIWKVSPCGLRM